VDARPGFSSHDLSNAVVTLQISQRSISHLDGNRLAHHKLSSDGMAVTGVVFTLIATYDGNGPPPYPGTVTSQCANILCLSVEDITLD
jgi:hypothetical protein